MEIKTLMGINVDKFDEAVNFLLGEGWKLARREVLTQAIPYMLYAELVKLDETDMKDQEAEPVTWQEAVEVLRETCGAAKDCGADFCPMYEWCQRNLSDDGNPPNMWESPEE